MTGVEDVAHLLRGRSSRVRGTSRIERIRDLTMAATSLWQLGNTFWEKAQGRLEERLFSVAVEEDSELFSRIQRWLVDQLPPGELRDVTAVVFQERDPDWVRSDRPPPWRLALENGTTRAQHVVLGRHRIKVEYEEPDTQVSSVQPGSGGGSQVQQTSYRSKAKLVFTAQDLGGHRAVVSWMRELLEELNTEIRPPSRVFTGTSWGGWERLVGQARPLETVFLHPGVKEQLIGDLERFLSMEKQYKRIGAPYHRGYLLHGPPGTGKTSLARGIANYFHLDLYYVSLADLSKDADVTLMFNRLEPHSVLLLEDIDALEAVQERAAPAKRKKGKRRAEGVTMTGILNNLDGAVTPPGLVVIMSTNHRDLLDEALLRTGRVDLELHVDYLGADQLRAMVRQLLDLDVGELPEHLLELRIPPVDVVEVIKQHLDDSDGQAAVQGIRELVERREKEMVTDGTE